MTPGYPAPGNDAHGSAPGQPPRRRKITRRQSVRLWTASLAYKGCTELAESFPTKAQAQQAIVKHLREYHLYQGPTGVRGFGAAMSWIAERDDRFDVQVFAQAARLAPDDAEGLEDDASGLIPVRRKRAYLRDGGGRCPLCRSGEIEGTGSREADGNWCTNEVECHACGAVWQDIYTLSDLQLTDPPPSKAQGSIHQPQPQHKEDSP